MVELAIEQGDVVVEVLGWSRLWALKLRLRFPLAAVRAVRLGAGVARGWKGWRFPGTQLPGVITAGTYHRRGHREFWDVRGSGHNALTIELARGPYTRLVVDVADPRRAMAMLEEERARLAHQPS